MQGEELTDRFLRILTDLAVNHCLTGESSTMTMRPGLLYFVAVDAYVRLLTMLITGTATPDRFVSWSALHAMHCLSNFALLIAYLATDNIGCLTGAEWLAEACVCHQNCTLLLLVLA